MSFGLDLDNLEKKYRTILIEGTNSTTPPKTLLKLYHEFLRPRLTHHKRLLEIGCGLNPLIESINEFEYKKAIDLSETAIDFCRSKYGEGKYLSQNFLNVIEPFDVLIDAHSIYFCESKEAFLNYLHHAYTLLPVDGYMMFEIGVQTKWTEIYPPYEFFGDILLKNGEFSRFAPNHLKLEELILESEFKIEYLYFNSSLKMIFDDSRQTITKWDLDLAQIILKKHV